MFKQILCNSLLYDKIVLRTEVISRFSLFFGNQFFLPKITVSLLRAEVLILSACMIVVIRRLKTAELILNESYLADRE